MAWSVGAATLPKRGQAIPGDAAWTWTAETQARVVVADGVGHGRRAAAVLESLQRSGVLGPSTDPEELLRRMHAVLQGSIGAVCMVVDVSVGPGRTHVRWSGVGNVRLWTQHAVNQPVEGRPGVVGQRLPHRLEVRDLTMTGRERIFVATDGVRRSVEAASRQLPRSCDSLDHVHSLLHAHHNPSDDGTLVVLCPGPETA